MATTKIVNQSILFPTAKNVDIATKIEFLYCFASGILSKQLLDGVHFAIQDGGPKSFPFKWKHWFLVSERSQLSKNVFGYNSPQKSSESFFLDITTLTKWGRVVAETRLRHPFIHTPVTISVMPG